MATRILNKYPPMQVNNSNGKIVHRSALLVKLDSISTKMNVLRGTVNLKDAGDRYRRIGIDHDYTPAQRDEHKILVAQARKKTDEDRSGNYVYRVRGPPGQQRIKAIHK